AARFAWAIPSSGPRRARAHCPRRYRISRAARGRHARWSTRRAGCSARSRAQQLTAADPRIGRGPARAFDPAQPGVVRGDAAAPDVSVLGADAAFERAERAARLGCARVERSALAKGGLGGPGGSLLWARGKIVRAGVDGARAVLAGTRVRSSLARRGRAKVRD